MNTKTAYIFEWHPLERDEKGEITKESAPKRENVDLMVSAVNGDGDGNLDSYIFISQWTGVGWTNCDTEIITAWAEMPKPYGKL